MDKAVDEKLQGFIQPTKALDEVKAKKEKLKEEMKRLEQKKALLEKRTIARAEAARRKLLMQKGEVLQDIGCLEYEDDILHSIFDMGWQVYEVSKESNFNDVNVLRRLSIAESVLTADVSPEIDLHVLLGMVLIAKEAGYADAKIEEAKQVAQKYLENKYK